MKNIKWMAICLLAGAMSFNACKKDDNSSTSSTSTPATDTELQVATAEDEEDINDEQNEVFMDANVALVASAFNGQGHGSTLLEAIIGGNVVVNNATKSLVINYDNKTRGNCGRTRAGKVTVALTSGAHWSDAGAVLTVTYEGYKANRACRGKNKVYTISGTTTITNVNGGLACFMMNGDTYIYEVNGSTSINMDGKQTAWNIARRLTFSQDNNVKHITLAGIGPNNKVVWGTDRHGREFEATISQPISVNSMCGYDEPTAGIKSYGKLGNSLTVTFAVDKNGNQVQAQDCSAYGYKVAWVDAKGENKTYVNAYR